MAYDDGRVACTEEALVIRTYYFPPHDKRIPYGKIEQVHQEPMSGVGGRYRLWGSGDFIHWYNYDPDRPRKNVKFIIHVAGHKIRPVITPNHPDAVAAELAAHGVAVTTS
ncbi:MAG TPA: hypothetical protein VKG80_14170 [Trebonia sp.]|nr:hypothetical protein [Trebonia sp.]